MEETHIIEKSVVEKLYTLWSTPIAALIPTPLKIGMPTFLHIWVTRWVIFLLNRREQNDSISPYCILIPKTILLLSKHYWCIYFWRSQTAPFHYAIFTLRPGPFVVILIFPPQKNKKFFLLMKESLKVSFHCYYFLYYPVNPLKNGKIPFHTIQGWHSLLSFNILIYLATQIHWLFILALS